MNVALSSYASGRTVFASADLHDHPLAVTSDLEHLQGDEMKQAGRAAGAAGWLVKPFDPNKLIEVIRKMVR